MSDAQRTYYEILGLAEDASPDDVSAARRSMLREVHPDLATDEADRQERELLSRAVNDMCDTLLDPIRRYDYDVRLARARNPTASGIARELAAPGPAATAVGRGWPRRWRIRTVAR